MALPLGIATLGELATIAGGDAAETGIALTVNKGEQAGYRYYKGRGAAPKRPAGAYPLNREYPSPKRLNFDRYKDDDMGYQRRGPKRTKTMGDQKHSKSERYSNSNVGNQVPFDLGELNFNRIDLPPRDVPTGGDSAPVNRRDNHIFLKGIKFDVEWHLSEANREENNANPHLGPLYINWALIQYKCQVPQAAIEPTLTATQEKFFVDTASSDKWFTSFGPYPAIPTQTNYSLLHHKGAMCPHNNYRILARRSWMKTPRLKVGTGTTSGVLVDNPGSTGVVKFKEYMKTPQRIYLEDVNNLLTWEHPIYEVFWVTPVNATHMRRYGTSTTRSTVGTKIAKNTLYFHELKI